MTAEIKKTLESNMKYESNFTLGIYFKGKYLSYKIPTQMNFLREKTINKKIGYQYVVNNFLHSTILSIAIYPAVSKKKPHKNMSDSDIRS